MLKQLALMVVLLLGAALAQAEAAPSFDVLDVNGDGYISMEEAVASAKVVAMFKEADANSDGRLTQDEYAAIMS